MAAKTKTTPKRNRGSAKAKTFTVTEVPVDKLKKAPHNPITRWRDINSLIVSMNEHGLYIPILITPGFDIIEGHRRVAAAEKLGWQTIKAVMAHGDSAKIYAEVNTVSRRFTGVETLNAYLVNPDAVGEGARRQIDAAIDMVGRAQISKMAKNGISLQSYNLARRVCRAVDMEEKATVKLVLVWMLKHMTQSTVKEILSRKTNMKEIINAAKRDKPITASYAAKK